MQFVVVQSAISTDIRQTPRYKHWQSDGLIAAAFSQLHPNNVREPNLFWPWSMNKAEVAVWFYK